MAAAWPPARVSHLHRSLTLRLLGVLQQGPPGDKGRHAGGHARHSVTRGDVGQGGDAAKQGHQHGAPPTGAHLGGSLGGRSLTPRGRAPRPKPPLPGAFLTPAALREAVFVAGLEWTSSEHRVSRASVGRWLSACVRAPHGDARAPRLVVTVQRAAAACRQQLCAQPRGPGRGGWVQAQSRAPRQRRRRQLGPRRRRGGGTPPVGVRRAGYGGPSQPSGRDWRSARAWFQPAAAPRSTPAPRLCDGAANTGGLCHAGACPLFPGRRGGSAAVGLHMVCGVTRVPSRETAPPHRQPP